MLIITRRVNQSFTIDRIARITIKAARAHMHATLEVHSQCRSAPFLVIAKRVINEPLILFGMISVHLVAVEKGQVTLGITAPVGVRIWREEILRKQEARAS